MDAQTEIMLGLVVGAFLFSAGAKAKNTVEDIVTVHDDSFTRWDALFQQYGGTDWRILKAIAMNESSLGTYPTVALGIREPSNIEGSKSQDGKSWGLMQMTLPTARDYDPYATSAKLNNPDYSIRLAAQFLRALRRQFDELEYVVKAYNQGAGNTRKELSGDIDGYAGEYWARFQRNYQLVLEA